MNRWASKNVGLIFAFLNSPTVHTPIQFLESFYRLLNPILFPLFLGPE